MKVKQILQRKPMAEIITVTPETCIDDAAKLLSEKRIGCVLVMDHDKNVHGILSERDIVRKLGEVGASCLKDDATSIMTAEIISCREDDDSESVLTKMTQGRFRHMPVMNEQDTLIGLISIGDVVAARMDSLQRDNEALESMIRSATA